MCLCVFVRVFVMGTGHGSKIPGSRCCTADRALEAKEKRETAGDSGPIFEDCADVPAEKMGGCICQGLSAICALFEIAGVTLDILAKATLCSQDEKRDLPGNPGLESLARS